MKNNTSQIIIVVAKVAFVCAVLCSTAYLLMLGWYNNLLLDDYGYVVEVDEGGAWGLMRNAYFGWQARFSAFYVLGWIMKIWGHAPNLIGYTVFLLLLGYGVIYYALRTIARLPHSLLLLGCSILITNVSIMAYMELSTFYWVCCAIYTLSSYAAIVLFTAIFFSKGILWRRWLAVILCSLYLCGGAENFTPVLIAALGIVLLYQMITTRSWRFWQVQEQQMIVVGLLILGIGFLVVVLGASTNARSMSVGESRNFMNHFALIPYFSKLIKSSAVFAVRLLSRCLYYVLLIPIGLVIGRYLIEPVHVERVGRKMLLAALTVACAILLSIAAPVYGMGWYAPLRAYSFVSFIISGLVMYCSVIIGQKCDSLRLCPVAFVASMLIIVSMSIRFMQTEQPMVKVYHAEIQKRNNLIREQVELGRRDPLQIDAVTHPNIPNSYAVMRIAVNKLMRRNNSSAVTSSIYFPYEQYSLSTDPNHWQNSDMKAYFNAQFDIIGWQMP